MSTTENKQQTKRERKWQDYVFMTCITLMIGSTFFLFVSIAPLTDVLEKEFHTTSSGVAVLSSSFFFVHVFALMPSGLVLEVLSCEVVVIGSTIIMSIGSMIFGMSPNIETAFVGRIIFGTGCAPVWLCGVSFIGQRFGNETASTWIGVTAFWANVSGMIGTSITAAIYTEMNEWRPIFYGFAAFAVCIAVVMTILHTSEQRSMNPEKGGGDIECVTPSEQVSMATTPSNEQVSMTLHRSHSIRKTVSVNVCEICILFVFFL